MSAILCFIEVVYTKHSNKHIKIQVWIYSIDTNTQKPSKLQWRLKEHGKLGSYKMLCDSNQKTVRSLIQCEKTEKI